VVPLTVVNARHFLNILFLYHSSYSISVQFSLFYFCIIPHMRDQVPLTIVNARHNAHSLYFIAYTNIRRSHSQSESLSPPLTVVNAKDNAHSLYLTLSLSHTHTMTPPSLAATGSQECAGRLHDSMYNSAVGYAQG